MPIIFLGVSSVLHQWHLSFLFILKLPETGDALPLIDRNKKKIITMGLKPFMTLHFNSSLALMISRNLQNFCSWIWREIFLILYKVQVLLADHKKLTKSPSRFGFYYFWNVKLTGRFLQIVVTFLESIKGLASLCKSSLCRRRLCVWH